MKPETKVKQVTEAAIDEPIKTADKCCEDFYLEAGFVVFTKAFHLKRGFCCRNNCRHCPYGYKAS